LHQLIHNLVCCTCRYDSIYIGTFNLGGQYLMGSICLKIIFLKSSVPAQRDGLLRHFLCSLLWKFWLQGQPQANTQPPRTRNPFESDSAPVSSLNLNALYEALPPQGMPLNRAPPQWGQPIPQFPPNAVQGGFGYGNYATPTMVM
jgi:hypothetical protein